MVTHSPCRTQSEHVRMRNEGRKTNRARGASTTLRILILSINYAPDLTSTGKYIGEMGEWLAQRGHEVRVVTAPPYYPAWQVGEGYSPRMYRRERMAGV